MSLAKKLIAGSALMLTTGCMQTIFESGSELPDSKENITIAQLIVRRGSLGYTMTVTEVFQVDDKTGRSGVCTYELGATLDGAVKDSYKKCEGAVEIKDSQRVFDKYMILIKEKPQK